VRCQNNADINAVWTALTDPDHLARWFGQCAGDLRVGGHFNVVVTASGFNGRGRISVCNRPSHLHVTMWEEVGREHEVIAQLKSVGDQTNFVIETRGVPLDVVWAYGAGWHLHVEDLRTHLSGNECATFPPGTDPRWNALETEYREMPVTPLAQ
jgi:uncharacterized protein YndB with AHSA1/START domain